MSRLVVGKFLAIRMIHLCQILLTSCSTCVSEESALAVAAIEDKIVGSDILIGEIEEQRGVDGDTEETSFEVEVRTKGASCVTTKTDELSGFYDFSNLSNALGEVTMVSKPFL